MQFADGGMLHEYLKAQQSTINDQERMRLVRQLTAGMAFLHSRLVLHPTTPLRIFPHPLHTISELS